MRNKLASAFQARSSLSTVTLFSILASLYVVNRYIFTCFPDTYMHFILKMRPLLLFMQVMDEPRGANQTGTSVLFSCKDIGHQSPSIYHPML